MTEGDTPSSSAIYWMDTPERYASAMSQSSSSRGGRSGMTGAFLGGSYIFTTGLGGSFPLELRLLSSAGYGGSTDGTCYDFFSRYAADWASRAMAATWERMRFSCTA